VIFLSRGLDLKYA